ncbi:MAG: hypothetical protein IKP06_05810 [Elusimicrobiaceae bacterium]|nr:hypothetical protein [Elusimicrobiaceae bacterium]
MKKQEVFTFIMALFMILSLARLSYGQEFVYNLNEYQNQKDFGLALKEGNLKAVKYLAETYTWLNLLNIPIKNEDGDKEQPICIAAGKGYTDLVEYMVSQEPDLVNKDCFENNPDYKALGKALDNGFADTALVLLKLGPPVTTNWRWNLFNKTGFRPALFVIVARTFTDRETLEKLIPALLDAGTPVDELVGINANYWDAFDYAAGNKNINFINILRDEMVKRGQTPISRVEIYADSHEASQEIESWHKEQKELLWHCGVWQEYKRPKKE